MEKSRTTLCCTTFYFGNFSVGTGQQLLVELIGGRLDHTNRLKNIYKTQTLSDFYSTKAFIQKFWENQTNQWVIHKSTNFDVIM